MNEASPSLTNFRLPTTTHWARRVIVGILLVSGVLRCVNLGHSSIKPLDEVFHAIVSRHLLHHPLTPTLNEHDFISLSPGDWQNAHVWLHKPPLALWQIAIAFKAISIGNFALRFPSALLATASAGLTYLITRHLFDRTTACLAALLQSLNPVLQMLVHGYVFSDHVDVTLLFWSELSIWLLLRLARSNERLDALLCGSAQGAAFLAKTFPALITTLLAIVLLILTRRNKGWRPLSWTNVSWLLFGTALVAGPWNIYAYVTWPQQYVAQTLGILSHLNRDVEGWAGPWDRLLIDYGWRVFHVFYPALIAASGLAIVQLIRFRDTHLSFTLAWALLVLLPNLLAVSKPMTATLVGWPAAWILLAGLMRSALKGDRRALIALAISTLGYDVLVRQPMPTDGWGFLPGNPFAGLLLANWQPVALGGIALLGALFMPPGNGFHRLAQPVAIGSITVGLICPLGGTQPRSYLLDFWRVSQIHRDDPVEPEMIRTIQTLPPHAIVLLETRVPLEDKLLQWRTGRDCWPLRGQDWRAWSRAIVDGGGQPYLITAEPQSFPALSERLPSGRRIYAVPP